MQHDHDHPKGTDTAAIWLLIALAVAATGGIASMVAVVIIAFKLNVCAQIIG